MCQKEVSFQESGLKNAPTLAREEAESVFTSFLQAGRRDNKCSQITMNLLLLQSKKYYEASDVAPVVRVKLERPKDLLGRRRVDLSSKVANMMSNTLSSQFTGNPQTADLILLVRVVLVSDGSAASRRFLLGRGSAKLKVAYCLYSRRTGELAMAKQLSYQDGYARYTGHTIVKNLARKTSESIRREALFLVTNKVEGGNCVDATRKVFPWLLERS
jgi:hypothetical protein